MEKSPTTAPLYHHCANVNAAQWLAMIAEKDHQLLMTQTALSDTQNQLSLSQQHLADVQQRIDQQQHYIRQLEEYLRLTKTQTFGASSEQNPYQGHLFDEAELCVALDELESQLPQEDHVRPKPKQRRRGLPPELERVRIELKLDEAQKQGAQRTFFSKVKEELEYIPAQLKVLEYWQEKAVFAHENGHDILLAAPRPTHPLGKCAASTSLLAYIMVAKYADGLPLYRLEGMFKRSGGDISRSCMAHWMIRLESIFRPLINLMREEQNSSDYLQVDETRIQVLKEPGKPAQSNQWMWVVLGGPTDKPVVLFTYDASRSGTVPERLLAGFRGVLQADGYSGYDRVCKKPGMIRIGCLDHARRKFVAAIKASDVSSSAKPSKAQIALKQINQLYAIEAKCKEVSHAKRYQVRQQCSVPILAKLKTWLIANQTKLLKGSLTYKAIQYTLNQWDYLIGYCQDGRLRISNALAENAIRPFAVGRKAWLFADTPQGARASATCYSLIETAKANHLEPYAYMNYVLSHIGDADTLEKLEALLPWNVPLEKCEKKVPVYNKDK